MPQTISIVIVGSSHRDPAAIKLLMHQITQIHKNRIAMVICEESPSDKPIKDICQEEGNLSLLNNIIRHSNIKSIMHQDAYHQKPYFLASDSPAIASALPRVLDEQFHTHKATMGGYPQIIINRFANLVRDHLAQTEKVKLHTLLTANQIPYQGIELPIRENEAFANALHSPGGSALFQRREFDRISHMTQKICVDAVKKLNGRDGIIISYVGFLHVQRLTASILLWCAQHQNANIEARTFPMCCTSKYSEDAVTAYKNEIQIMGAKDPSDIQNIYATFQTPLITIEENANFYAFTSTDFECVFAQALQHCAPDKSATITNHQDNDERPDPLADNDIGYKPSAFCCNCNVM